jgi:photosystem II stability/assembly factor-like uncharacterized protein
MIVHKEGRKNGYVREVNMIRKNSMHHEGFGIKDNHGDYIRIAAIERVILKFLFPFLIVSVHPGFSIAQTWKFVGGPGGIYVNDMMFTRSGTLISATWQGLFFSKDFGTTWQSEPVNPAFGIIYSLTQRANGNLVAIAANGILGSSDGGTSWNLLYQVFGLNIYANCIICESPIDSSLYYGANYTFYRSTDGGRNWSEIWNGNFIRCYAIDESGYIYLAADSVGLLRSMDNGLTFKKFSIYYPLENEMVEMILPDRFGGLYLKIFGPTYAILHYGNAKSTEIQFGSTNLPLAVIPNGDLIYKADNCIGLYSRSTGEGTIVSCPSFVIDQFAQKAVVYNNVWITSFSSLGLHRSVDGGHTWSDINSGLGNQQCLSLMITDDEKIYAGTFGWAFWGGLYMSSDTGKTWTNLNPLNYNAYFIALDKLKNGNILAGGSYGEFMWNEHNGRWVQVSDVSLTYSQYVSNNGTIYVGDIYNGIYVSTDNGGSWVESNNGLDNSLFFGFGESETGRVFAAAWPEGSYYTDNHGENWTSISDPHLYYSRAYDFKFKSDTLFAGINGGIVFSVDSGTSWNSLPGISGAVQEIAIAPDGEILASVPGQGIYVSSDNGSAWTAVNAGLTDLNVWCLHFDKSGRLFAATNEGIFETDAFLNAESLGGSVFTLRQNYPNPFNSQTLVSFDVAAPTRVSLKVCNILGQEVATLFDREYSAGHYQYPWNASRLPSGVYFLRLSANGHTKTAKALLLK